MLLLTVTCQDLSVATHSGQDTQTRQALIYLSSLTLASSYSSIRIPSRQDEAKETGVEKGALTLTDTVSAPGLRQRLFWDIEILNLAH